MKDLFEGVRKRHAFPETYYVVWLAPLWLVAVAFTSSVRWGLYPASLQKWLMVGYAIYLVLALTVARSSLIHKIGFVAAVMTVGSRMAGFLELMLDRYIDPIPETEWWSLTGAFFERLMLMAILGAWHIVMVLSYERDECGGMDT